MLDKTQPNQACDTESNGADKISRNIYDLAELIFEMWYAKKINERSPKVFTLCFEVSISL